MPTDTDNPLAQALHSLDGYFEGERKRSWGPEVVVELLHDDAQRPKRATDNSAGYDVCAYLRNRFVQIRDDHNRPSQRPVREGHENGGWYFYLNPGERALVPLGFKATMPAGMVAKAYIRSGTAFKTGLTNAHAVGIIDADYPDEWLAMVRNDAAVPVTISHGDRIAQLVFQRYEVVSLVDGVVTATTDRTGGVGSTGTR